MMDAILTLYPAGLRSSDDGSTLPGMADALPAGFPSDITDVELRAVILGCVAALQKRAPDDVGTWLPELQLAVALIGISEQSRRNLATSSKIAIGSLLVAAAALAVAFVTLLAA